MSRILVVLLLTFTGAVSVHADTAYTDPANQGTQNFTGNLALDFNVNSPITVTALGVFDASGTGTIAGTVQVVIFNTVTNTEVTPVVTFSGAYTTAGLGFDVFEAITPVVLGAGSYQIDVVGLEVNGNLNTGSSGPVLNGGGGLLTFTGASYDGSATLDRPLTCSGCQSASIPQSQQFDAGTFQFNGGSVVTPEPSSLLLLSTGFLGLVGAIRRKQLV